MFSAGDMIATIDDGDYRLAVDAARDKVATQQATIDRIGRQIDAQQAAIDQAKAQLASAQAARQARRTGTRPRSRAWRAANMRAARRSNRRRPNRDQTIAGVQSAQAALEAAQAAVGVLQAQQQEAARTAE